MVHLKNVSLRACSCHGCGAWLLCGFDGHRHYILCNWMQPMPKEYIDRPSFADVYRDLTDVAASEHFTLPGEPDALALQLLRETEPKFNVGRGFAA